MKFVQELKEKAIPIENVRICYSPFSRTTHTANVVASVLNVSLDGPQCKVRQCTSTLQISSKAPCMKLKSIVYHQYENDSTGC